MFSFAHSSASRSSPPWLNTASTVAAIVEKIVRCVIVSTRSISQFSSAAPSVSRFRPKWQTCAVVFTGSSSTNTRSANPANRRAAGVNRFARCTASFTPGCSC